jgi:SPP1 gp7 family putative phage head morphogenesis protein
MVLLGDTPDRAVKTIKEAMNSSLFQAKRLVFTEQAYFATEAQKNAFNSLDVERFEVVSSADRKVCPVCAAKDKKNFPMIEFHIGITAPPFHPLCRCVTAPFFDDEFTSQTRIVKDDNGDKYEIPATMNYQEWKDAFLGGGSKKGLAKVTERGKLKMDLQFFADKTAHAVERTEGREVQEADISDALKNPLYKGEVVVDDKGRKSVKYIGRNATAVMNPDTGKVVTVWKTGKRTRKKYEKEE